jgi:riboflavin kinase/FMN adenylyltransferase
MRLIRRQNRPVEKLEMGCVATIGAFDGLHLGHRQIIARLKAEATVRGLPTLVFSFEPTPKEYFSRGTPPARLMKFREKFQALEELGIDWFYCPRFGAAFANLAPDEFIDRLLVDLLHVRHLIVGDDFRFGRARAGTLDDLQCAGAAHGFTVEQISSVSAGTERVSSSVVRAALEQGDMQRARQLLGDWYRMAGMVVRGQMLGRQLGMPTANVKLNRKLSPVQGIFAVRVGGLQPGHWLDGVASIGTRPTINGIEPLLEVHIFDFDRDIYGAHIQVEFIAKLRDEVRFADINTLRTQMFVDAEQARSILTAI